MDPIFRHVAACNNAVLPGRRLPLLAAGQLIGYLQPELVPVLLQSGAVRQDGAIQIEPGQLAHVARMLADQNAYRWRGEAFDVRADPDGPVMGQVDRGALPCLGIQAVGVHLNGLVDRPDGLHLWVARRAVERLLDPGKLDHLVAGGVPAGLTPRETLVKEAGEEAGLSPSFLQAARHVATIDYAMDRSDGLRRDRLHCYDLDLPQTFVPEARDGEVEAFELWPIQDVLDRVRGSDDFKFNVNLVLIDLFHRRGLLAYPDNTRASAAVSSSMR